MKKNPWLYVGIIALVIGCAVACFTDIADIPALVVAAFGLGAMVVSTWEKSEKKGPVTIISIALLCIGGFFCAVAGLGQDVTLQVVSCVIALVTLLIGILLPKVIKKS